MAVLLLSLVFSQDPVAPLQTPSSAKYPGVYESFEKLIQFDDQRFLAKEKELQKAKRTLADLVDVNTVDIDPDFMNSIILNSPSGYLRIAGKDKCAFYDSMLADLLQTKDGKIQKVFIQYQDKNSQNVSAIVPKQDFLDKVVYKSCPQTKTTVAKFQIKVIDGTIKDTNFEMPNNREQCDFLYNTWVNDSKTPYWCQIHELLEETSGNQSLPEDFKARQEVQTKMAVGKILRGKLTDAQQDFIKNFCTHADNSKLFCDEFFSTNYFSKVVEGTKPAINIKDICQTALGKNAWSPAVIKECARKLRSEQEACFWGSYDLSGISPRPRCDHLSLALNFSSLHSEYNDCPRYSDQQGVTNMSRVIRHLEKPPEIPLKGFCSIQSAGTVFEFNRRFGNEDMWKAGVCYMDRVEEKEKCLPMFFGDYANSPASLTNVLSEVLFRTKGAPKDIKCEIVKQSEYSPTLLEYRYGCFVIVSDYNCGMANCDFKLMYNEKEVKDIKFREGLAFDYFPTDLMNEKYSQTYILQKDAQKKSRGISTITALKDFFKTNPSGILHGIGCAEDLLPGFFKKYAFNQCTPLPFIVDGIVSEGDRMVLITRSAADNIHAPRLISWSLIYSAVSSYQHHHPVRQWTLHGIY